MVSTGIMAHPVAYEGAFSFMSMNTEGSNENTLVYSPKYYLGTGVKYTMMKDKGFDEDQGTKEQWVNLHLGYLVKRWNDYKYQGNLYLFGGPGYVFSDSNSEHNDEYFTRVGFQADWETRRIYTLARYNAALSKYRNVEEYTLRFGAAPYLAGFDDLNAWIILEAKHSPQSENETEVSPILRMFYQNILWEVGGSFNNNWILNFMVRY